MTRQELEHAIRAACDVADDDAVYVFGSQAILGQVPDAPTEFQKDWFALCYGGRAFANELARLRRPRARRLHLGQPAVPARNDSGRRPHQVGQRLRITG